MKEIVRLAALLHDVGHGPFSHLFEKVMERVNGKKIDHDKISMMLIREDPHLSSILGEKVDNIISILDHKPAPGLDKKISSLATDIVSSPLDVDKMDYLRRDSYHIGVTYGQFDLPRMIHTLTYTDNQRERKICIDVKGQDSVESYRLGRYLMHAQVYKHHARLIGDQMFLQSLDLAVSEESIISREELLADTDLSKTHGEFLDFYTGLDDHTLYDRILRHGDSKAAKILKRIRSRDLLKRVVEYMPDKEIINAQVRDHLSRLGDDDLRSMSYEIASEANLDKHDVIVHSSDMPVNLYEGEIMIMRNGTPRKLDEFSPIDVRRSAINKFYVFGPSDDEAKQQIRKCVERRLDMGAADRGGS